MGTPQLLELVRKARGAKKEREFPQSFELSIAFKDVDVKKGFSISENVFLPHAFSRPPFICIFASGDMALRAVRSGVERVVEPDEIDRLATAKREARKIAKGYTFFLAEAPLMPKIGKVLGPYLGPKGKMPTPVPPGAPIEGLVKRYRSATRVRTRGQLGVSCKVGDEGMEDEKVVENSSAVINAVEKKLPMGAKNIRRVLVKLTMSTPVKLPWS